MSRRWAAAIVVLALALGACDVGGAPEDPSDDSDERATADPGTQSDDRDGDPDPGRDDQRNAPDGDDDALDGGRDDPAGDRGEGRDDPDEPPLSDSGRLVVTAASIDEHDIPTWLDGSVAASRLEISEAEDGSPAMHASYDGGGDNGYARVQVAVDWEEGDEVEYGLRFHLPAGFHAAQEGAVDIIRWDNWDIDDEHPDHGGIAIGSDGRLRLIAEQRHVEEYRALAGGVEIPEGRWIEVTVRQTLSASPDHARNELLIDGRRVGSSREPNASGRTITTLRAGLVSIDSGAQQAPLELLFDDVVVEPALGSVG